MTDFINRVVDNAAFGAAALMFLFLIAALVVNAFVTKGLTRLAARTRTSLDDELIRIVQRPIFSTVLLVGGWFVVIRLDPSIRTLSILEAVLITLGVLFWTGAGMRTGKLLLGAVAAKQDRYRVVQPRTLPIFDIAVKTLVVGGAVYGVLLAWEVDVTAWLASAGILGIAIGFAAKDTLSNLFSGIFILADAPYKLGDYIVLGTGERGQVTEIGIRSTRILTRDDIEIIVPNAVIANTMIVNETGGRHPKRRVRVDVGVAYGSDIDQVRAVLMDIAARSQYIVPDPEPRVRFRALGDSSLDFQLMGWIAEPAERGRAVDELLTSIYKRFAQEGIAIPFPQREVHLNRD